MEAIVVTCQVYSDRIGPTYDVLFNVTQLLIEKDNSLIVITPLKGKVSVSLVNKDYLNEVNILKKVKIPRGLVKNALQQINYQTQLVDNLNEMNLQNQLSSTEIGDLDIQIVIFRQIEKHRLK
jgi:hypothetical protein